MVLASEFTFRWFDDMPIAKQQPIILLVEDNLDDAELSAGFLRAAGCRVIVCKSGEAALRKIDQKIPCDAILSDLRMPGIGGHGLLRALQSKGIKFLTVILSSSSYYKDIDLAYESGASLFVVKPDDIEDWRKVLYTLTALYFHPCIKRPTPY